MNFSIDHLPNGLTLVLKKSSAAPVVAFQLWLGVGSADERPHEAGLAHVMEHMLFKGTARRGVGQIPRDVERAGGYINAWTSHDETVFHITMAAKFAQQGIDILADAVQNAALNTDDLKSELQVILEEVRMGDDNPGRISTEQLFKTMFKKHPYGRPVIGYADVVESFNRRTVKNFYKRWYVPQNAVLVVVGDFNHKRMRELVENHLGNWKGNKPPRRLTRTEEPPQRKVRMSHRVSPFSEANIAIGFPVPGLTNEDVPALDLLAAILGQGSSSRLENVVKRKMKLATDVRAISFTPKDKGVFGVFAMAPPHNITAATRALSEQIFRLTQEPVSPREIEKARSMLLSDNVYSEETVDGLARKFGYYGLHTKDVSFERNYFAALITADSDTLLEVAKKYILPSRSSVCVVVPDPAHRKYDHAVKWITEGQKKPTVKDSLFKKEVVDALRAGAAKQRKSTPQDGVRIVELAGGDTLIIKPDPASSIVAVRAAFPGGLRSETATTAGASILASNCLTRGTNYKSAVEIAIRMDHLACAINGFAGRNTFGIVGEFMAKNFPDGFTLMSECLRSSTLPKEEVDREKTLLLDEIRANKDNLDVQVMELFQRTLFGKHPYGRSMLGTKETVSSLCAAKIRSYINKVTQPGKMVLAVVGGVDPDEVIELAQSHILSPPKKAGKLLTPALWKPQNKPAHAMLNVSKEQSHIVVGFPGTTLNNDERFTIELLSEILGGHGGRLFEDIREKRGLAYSVAMLSMEGLEPGYLAAYAGTSPGNETAVVDAILSGIEHIKNHPPTKEETSRVKQHLLGTRAISMQRTSARAAGTSLGYLYGLGHDIDEQYPNKIKGITPEQITATARKYFNPKKMVIACVGPKVEKLDFS